MISHLPVNELNAAFAAWCKAPGVSSLLEDGDLTTAHIDSVAGRLDRFHGQHVHQRNSGMLKATVRTINRGVYLLLAGLRWQEPAVGEVGTNAKNKTALVRGHQWQLVMAYGGIEPIIKSLLKIGRGGLQQRDFQSIIKCCTISDCARILVPGQSQRMYEDWFDGTAPNDLLAFLGFDNGDRTIVETWLLKGQDLKEWHEALALAKAIRNATAHGALSPTKVKAWKLEKTIPRLTRDIGLVAEAILRQLAA